MAIANCGCLDVETKGGHLSTCSVAGDRFIVKDGGTREQFTSGMVREPDNGKIDYTRIMDGPMYDRWAVHLSKGAIKYPDVEPGVANWLLANSEAELIRAKKSAARHFRQWMRGDLDEDHAAAFFFNVNQVEYIKNRLKERPKENVCGTCEGTGELPF